MKSAILLTAITGIAFVAHAQTKNIAFKSHSGSASNFRIAMETEEFNPEHTDFGMVARPRVRDAQLDTVIFVSNEKAIMITSEYCTRVNRTTREPASPQRLWRAGADTVYNHPLFSHRHSLDSIISVLKSQYYFKNSIDKTIFIGFDNENEEEGPVPVTIHRQRRSSPVDGEFAGILSCILICSAIGAWVGWKYGD